MKTHWLVWQAIFLILQWTPVCAAAADSAAVKKSVASFLEQQIQGLPGKSSYLIGAIDAGRLTDTCSGFDTKMAAGARPWGNTYVTVACRGGSWTLRVPVKISVIAEYLVSARPLTAGQAVTAEDLRSQSGEYSVMPNGTLMDMQQAVGRVMAVTLPAGRPLRADMLRQPSVVRQGQSVRLLASGNGFQVTGEGRALTHASIGQVVQVRLNSGQVLSGVAQADGSVEIRN